jgi:hypothetical protein
MTALVIPIKKIYNKPVIMMMFTQKDHNKGVTKSNLYTINADQPIRHKEQHTHTKSYRNHRTAQQ